MENKANKIIFIVLIVLGIALIGLGVYKGFLEKKSEPQETKQEPVKTISFSGVYQKGNEKVKIYQKKDDSIAFNLEKDDYGVVFDGAVVNGKIIQSILENNYTLSLQNGNLKIETNDTKIEAGDYSKISDYTINDYFNDNYGNETLLNSKYNGEFKQDSITAYLYQKDETTVRLSLNKNIDFLALDFTIDANGKLTSELFDNKYEIEVTDNSFTFKETSKEEKKYDGVYTKVKALTIEEIIEKFI